MKCEYCNRSAYMNDGATCAGCGAPLSSPATPSIMYDPQVFATDMARCLGQPSVNIPVNMQQLQGERLSDWHSILQGAASVGATLARIRW
jgi:hypothetical protein